MDRESQVVGKPRPQPRRQQRQARHPPRAHSAAARPQNLAHLSQAAQVARPLPRTSSHSLLTKGIARPSSAASALPTGFAAAAADGVAAQGLHMHQELGALEQQMLMQARPSPVSLRPGSRARPRPRAGALEAWTYT